MLADKVAEFIYSHISDSAVQHKTTKRRVLKSISDSLIPKDDQLRFTLDIRLNKGDLLRPHLPIIIPEDNSPVMLHPEHHYLVFQMDIEGGSKHAPVYCSDRIDETRPTRVMLLQYDSYRDPYCLDLTKFDSVLYITRYTTLVTLATHCQLVTNYAPQFWPQKTL